MRRFAQLVIAPHSALFDHLSTPLIMQPTTALFVTLALLSRLAFGHPGSECAAGLDGQLPDIIPSDFHFSGNVRTHYIQAEQDTWDYAPSGWDNACSPTQTYSTTPY